MKIKITFELSDDDRSAIGGQTGEGKASHERCSNWIVALVRATLDGIIAEQAEEADRVATREAEAAHVDE
jgi:hypothetical protein